MAAPRPASGQPARRQGVYKGQGRAPNTRPREPAHDEGGEKSLPGPGRTGASQAVPGGLMAAVFFDMTAVLLIQGPGRWCMHNHILTFLSSIVKHIDSTHAFRCPLGSFHTTIGCPHRSAVAPCRVLDNYRERHLNTLGPI